MKQKDGKYCTLNLYEHDRLNQNKTHVSRYVDIKIEEIEFRIENNKQKVIIYGLSDDFLFIKRVERASLESVDYSLWRIVFNFNRFAFPPVITVGIETSDLIRKNVLNISNNEERRLLLEINHQHSFKLYKPVDYLGNHLKSYIFYADNMPCEFNLEYDFMFEAKKYYKYKILGLFYSVFYKFKILLRKWTF